MRRDAHVPPKSEWETLLATTASALKYMMREVLQDVSHNVFVLLMPPHAGVGATAVAASERAIWEMTRDQSACECSHAEALN
jgi:hypothetical protein